MPSFNIIENRSQINLDSQWISSTKFNSKDRIVDEDGNLADPNCAGRRLYQIIEKRERAFSTEERIARGFIGVLLVICTLSLALFSKFVRDLLIKSKETIRFAVSYQKSSQVELNVDIERQFKNEINPNDDVYEGQSVNGLRHGFGKMTFKNLGVYEGQWEKDKMHGSGKMTYENGDVYDGQWVNGLRHGSGKMTFANGDVYEGRWVKDLRDGYGKMTYANGDVYDGHWVKDLRHGYGKMTYISGDVFDGVWECDREIEDGDIYDC